jgi:AMMECR1 domain-containing protein
MWGTSLETRTTTAPKSDNMAMRVAIETMRVFVDKIKRKKRKKKSQPKMQTLTQVKSPHFSTLSSVQKGKNRNCIGRESNPGLAETEL